MSTHGGVHFFDATHAPIVSGWVREYSCRPATADCMPQYVWVALLHTQAADPPPALFDSEAAAMAVSSSPNIARCVCVTWQISSSIAAHAGRNVGQCSVGWTRGRVWVSAGVVTCAAWVCTRRWRRTGGTAAETPARTGPPWAAAQPHPAAQLRAHQPSAAAGWGWEPCRFAPARRTCGGGRKR